MVPRSQNLKLKPGPKPRASDGLAPGTKVWRWRGQDYYGAADVANGANCTVARVYSHMRRYGNLDNLEPSPRTKSPGNATGKGKPVAIDIGDGVTYEWPSIRQLALSIGWATSSAQRCYQSTGRGRAKLVAAVAAWSKEQSK